MKYLLASTVASAAAFGAANAATVTVVPAPPGVNESDVVSCIFGNNSQGCDDEFLLPAGAPGQSVDELSRTYTVGEIRDLVGNLFEVGIDSNTAPGRPEVQLLTQFQLTGDDDEVLFELDMDSYEINTPVAQGTGFSDYFIRSFDLTGLDDDEEVTFTLSLEGLTGGAEQFFFRDVAEIPVPGAIWLMGAGVAGFGFASRRRRKNAAIA